MKKLILAVLIALVAELSFIPVLPVQADDYPQPPANPEESWQPPEEGGTIEPPVAVEQYSGSSSDPQIMPQQQQLAPQQTQIAPGVMSIITNAFLVDSHGQVLSNLYWNEPCYLIVYFNGPGYFYLWEYYPAGTPAYGHWLCYRWYRPVAGAWKIGPFVAEPGDPAGRYTWKMWYVSGVSWSTRLLSFYFNGTYYPPDIPSPAPIPMPIPVPVPEPVYYPTINSFSTNKSTIDAADTAVLSWTTTNASSVTISPNVGAVGATGSTSVTPASTTIYTLLAESKSGKTASSTVTITVTPRVPPVISAGSSLIKRGEPTIVSWDAPGAVSVSVSGIGSVGVKGNTEVAPEETTTYTISATYIDGTAQSAQVTVAVEQPTYWLWILIAVLVVVAAVVIFLVVRRHVKSEKAPATAAATTKGAPTEPASADTTVSTDTLPITTPLIEEHSSRLVMPDGNEILLASNNVLMGRKDFEDFMPRENITYISRQHINIWYENGKYYVEDRSSTNGTRVNSREIKGTGRHAVADGDVVELASKLRIIFRENTNKDSTNKEV
jgi:pSer/pThr/pTyr-binding forkhead associated (FHA) protein